MKAQHTDVTLFARLRRFAWNRGPLPPFEAGCEALDRGRLDEALAHFAAALALPEPPVAVAVHNKIGIVHARRGAHAEAAAAFVEALLCDPGHVPAITNVGNLCLESGSLDDAVVHYEAALRLDDNYAVAHLNLGVAYKRLGRRGDAVREFRRANRLEGRLKLGR
jgi:tetratricopeptide (TPR) repeat protein